jgi:tRNA (cytidine32/guanosine34-2'-O)-methyltransferase
LEQQLDVFFQHVLCMKPLSSRPSSAESFVVCRGFCLPVGYKPSLFSAIPSELMTFYQKKQAETKSQTEVASTSTSTALVSDVAVPFLACGDLSGFDSLPVTLDTTHQSSADTSGTYTALFKDLLESA